MRRTIGLGLLLIALWTAQALAGPEQRIELRDGSVIHADVLSFNGSVYTVRSGTLGTLSIEASKVRSVHMGSSSLAGRPEFRDLQNSMQASPETLNMILGLQNDPDVQAVLQDPELMKAVNAGDVDRLISNPKFMRLLENPKVQEIGRRVLR
jgi:hypothetical protein